MYIKVFQINSDRDKNCVKFCGLTETEQYQGAAQIDASLYDEVFSGNADSTKLDDIYELFNTNPPPFFRGHSLSVSDIIATQNGCYFVGRVGFEPVEFDESLTRKPDNLLRVAQLEPGKPAYETEVADHFRAFQRAVGGLFEVAYPFEDNAVLICNEEGRIHGMEPNRVIGGMDYVGRMFIIGDGGNGNFCSLTDEQVKKYLAEFQSPEFSDPDEDMDSGITMT
jgi:hypothetical protein